MNETEKKEWEKSRHVIRKYEALKNIHSWGIFTLNLPIEAIIRGAGYIINNRTQKLMLNLWVEHRFNPIGCRKRVFEIIIDVVFLSSPTFKYITSIQTDFRVYHLFEKINYFPEILECSEDEKKHCRCELE